MNRNNERINIHTYIYNNFNSVFHIVFPLCNFSLLSFELKEIRSYDATLAHLVPPVSHYN